MVKTLKAQTIDLRYLIDNFGLQRIRDDQFFKEWQTNLPELTDIKKQKLDRVQEGYFNLVREETPKYALSDEFVIDNRGNELYSVLKIIKRLSQLGGE